MSNKGIFAGMKRAPSFGRRSGALHGIFDGLDDDPVYDVGAVPSHGDDRSVYVGEDAPVSTELVTTASSGTDSRKVAALGIGTVLGLVGGGYAGHKAWKKHSTAGAVLGALIGSGIGGNIAILLTGGVKSGG